MATDKITFEDMTGIKLFPPQISLIRNLSLLPGESVPRLKRYIFNVFCFLCFAGSTYQVISCQLGLKEAFAIRDSFRIANSVSYTGIFAGLYHKFFTIKFNIPHLIRLGHWAKEAKARRGDFEPLPMKLSRAVNFGHYMGTYFVWIFWSFYPVIKHTTVFPLKYPFFPGFFSHISFPHEVIIYGFAANIISYVAAVFMYMIATFCTEAQILANDWSQLKYDRKQPEQFKEQLKSLTDRHVELLEIYNVLKKLHEGIFGYQVITTMSISFGAIFGVLKLEDNALPAIIVGITLGATSISEFFIMCWMGEHTTEAFKNFHRNVYNSNWYEASVKERHCVQIVQEFAKRPIVLTGAKLIKASLSTFIFAMREVFSLYTVVKAIMVGKSIEGKS